MSDEPFAAVVRLLENRRGYAAFIGVCLLVGGYALLAGPRWLAAMAAIGVFVYGVDALSMTLWDRVDDYLERRESNGDGPERTLTPHSMSRSTKVIVIVGTILSAVYLAVGAIGAVVASFVG